MVWGHLHLNVTYLCNFFMPVFIGLEHSGITTM